MGTVLRRFPRKTVNSQTDSDAAYTFRACINKSKRKICIIYLYVKHYNFKIVLYANWVPMPSISIRWKRFKEDRSDHAFYVQWKATYINNRCNIKLK